jgi:hypothetical protein
MSGAGATFPAVAKAKAKKTDPKKKAAPKKTAAPTKAKTPAAAKKAAATEPPIRPVRPGSRAPAPPPQPAPPPVPAPVVPVRVVPDGPTGELAPARDVSRLLRHGEQFGAHRIEIRHLPTPVVVTSGRIAVADPRAPKGGKVLARKVAAGRFRVMLGVARVDGEERVAAAVMHVGRPPIARWVIAHFEGGKPPKSAEEPPVFDVGGDTAAFMDALVLDELRALDDPSTFAPDPAAERNLVAFASGWGDGAYASYWALDAAGHPVCLVTDFDLFTKAEWKVAKKK